VEKSLWVTASSRDMNALHRSALEAAEKVSYFVIPNEVRNLSGF
jgi:hypothetical protein